MGFQRLPLKIVEWIAKDLKGEAADSGDLKKSPAVVSPAASH